MAYKVTPGITVYNVVIYNEFITEKYISNTKIIWGENFIADLILTQDVTDSNIIIPIGIVCNLLADIC